MKYWMSISGSRYFLSLHTLPYLYSVNDLIIAIKLIWFDCYAEEMKCLSTSTAWRASTHKVSITFYSLAWKYQKYEAVIIPCFPKVTLPLWRQVY